MTDSATTSSTTTSVRAVGRRKEAAARARITMAGGDSTITINSKPLEKYFGYGLYQEVVRAPLKLVGMDAATVSVKVAGGGTAGQATAIRHAISRALIILNPEFRKTLKAVGFLSRDPRMKERKKFGLKKARRAPQWSKR